MVSSCYRTSFGATSPQRKPGSDARRDRAPRAPVQRVLLLQNGRAARMSVYRKCYNRRDGTPARTSMYYVEFRDHVGRLQVVSGFHDKDATRALERKLLQVAALRATDAPLDVDTHRWIEG